MQSRRSFLVGSAITAAVSRSAIGANDRIGFAITVNDMDYDPPKQLDPKALGLFGGIASGKNPDNFGILTLTFLQEGDYDKLDQGDDLEIADIRKLISAGGNPVIRNKTKDNSFQVTCNLSARQKQIVLAGGALNVRNTNPR